MAANALDQPATPAGSDDHTRCDWGGDQPLLVSYHDEEWGVPLHDDRRLFELLTLEGAQAGLSWLTILKRRETYRRAFDGWDIERIAAYGETDRERLLADPGIIRNRAKVSAAISNAQVCLELRHEFGSFDAYLWGLVEGAPRRNAFTAMADIPASTEQSEAMSRALKQRGFRFVGPTICYAFMQATGMVNDHLRSCFRYRQLWSRAAGARRAGASSRSLWWRGSGGAVAGQWWCGATVEARG